jgi:hypothetical protein
MLKRFPKSHDILQVYAVIAVMFSGWTITAFFRKLPSWLLTLNMGEIFTVFSYAMVTNLVESLVVLLILLTICVLFPHGILRDDFAVRGTILAIGLIGSLIMFLGLHKQFGMENGGRLWNGLFGTLLLMVVILGLSIKSRFVQSAALWISDRLIVFLFILIPLFVLLLVYVIIRNMI